MNAVPFVNTILRHLEPDVVRRLQLRPVQLELRHELATPGDTIDHLYFVEAGIGSMTVVFRNGDQVEVGMFGYESVVGVSALMGARKSLNHIFMQMPGHGFVSPVAAARAEFDRFGPFHQLALRYVQSQLTQSTQSAACNAKHNAEQRLARWLLICADRAGQTSLAISQEFIAEMLGNNRTSVSLAASSLKQKGLIDYSRGVIQLVDVRALEEQACECYLVVKHHLSNLAEFDTGFAV